MRDYQKSKKILKKSVQKLDIDPIFIQNDEGKFLIQKRSERKNGKYASTGGHPKSGQTSLEGIITEVKEEIGLELDINKLKLYYTSKSDIEQSFWDDYYIKMNIENINELKLQKEEVDFLKWCTKEEIHKMYKDNIFFKNDYEEFIRLLEWLKNNNN